jgi:hypothetical protein
MIMRVEHILDEIMHQIARGGGATNRDRRRSLWWNGGVILGLG